MFLTGIIRVLSPYARVGMAVGPFLAAFVLRIAFGKNRYTQVLLSVSTVWFLVNVLMAPYSEGMRQDIVHLQQKLR